MITLGVMGQTRMIYKLKEVAELQKGHNFKEDDITEEKGIKIVRTTNLSNPFNELTYYYLKNDLFEKYRQFELKQNDILLTTVGSWPNHPNSVVGQIYVFPDEVGAAVLNQNILRIRARKCCSQWFLYKKLMERQFHNYLICKAKGSAKQASITLDDISDYELEIPELSIQKEQAEILKIIQKKIELSNKEIRMYEELRNLLINNV